MRLSTGGFYEIDGRALRAVPGAPAGPVAANGWRDRQADLWAESSVLMHIDRRLTADEIGLCGAMERELDGIRRALNGLEEVARAAAAS
jgi:hypothetical protein